LNELTGYAVIQNNIIHVTSTKLIYPFVHNITATDASDVLGELDIVLLLLSLVDIFEKASNASGKAGGVAGVFAGVI
jgi:hypothetical protein